MIARGFVYVLLVINVFICFAGAADIYDECVSDVINRARENYVCLWAREACLEINDNIMTRFCSEGEMRNYREIFEGHTDEEFAKMTLEERELIVQRLFCKDPLGELTNLTSMRQLWESTTLYHKWLEGMKRLCFEGRLPFLQKPIISTMLTI